MLRQDMTAKILLVDDDRNLLAACERNLRRKFAIETAEGADAALAKLDAGASYAVVVADRQMPGMDGVQLLAKVREKSPNTVRMMLTGNADLESVIHLVNESNIFRFLTKPCPPEVLAKALEDAQDLYQLTIAEKELLNKTLSGSIKLLTDILSMVESQSFGQAQQLRDAISAATERLGLDNAWEIHLAVMLAPIGLVTIPPETLIRSRAARPLSEVEQQMLAHVPETAARLLANIPRLEGVARIVRYQNKNFDGSGYPLDAVAGDAIPVGARLLRLLVDLMDLQRGGRSQVEAFEHMRGREGLYDPILLTALRRSLEGKFTGPVPATRWSLPVAVVDLAKGMVLRSNVETKDGTLILAAGHRINDMTLEKILNFQSIAGIKEPIMVESAVPPP
ncbi:MAG: HD domain-containing phosphohydrolase [Verrucomicrobiota bacterium]|jgi:response regulator RpfG family c-di-GMP phosphodiesterase